MKEKKKFTFFPHSHYCRHESGAHTAAPIQQPAAVEPERERQSHGCICCSSSPSERSPPSKATRFPPKATRPSKSSSCPSKRSFIGSLKGFFVPCQLPTALSSLTRQRSTKSTKATTTTVVVNNRNLPSDDLDIEDSASEPRGFHPLFRSPSKQQSKWETGSAGVGVSCCCCGREIEYDVQPSLDFSYSTVLRHQPRTCSSIREKLTHCSIVVVRKVDLSCQTYRDDYRSSSRALIYPCS